MIGKDSFGQFCPLLDNLKSDKILQNILMKSGKSNDVVRCVNKS